MWAGPLMVVMQPKIVEKPELLIAGCEAPFIHALSPEASNSVVIPQVWDRLRNHLQTVPHQSCEPMDGLREQRAERAREMLTVRAEF